MAEPTTPPTFSIVVIDDTPDNLRLLFRILSKDGYRVRPLPSGAMGLTAIQKEPPNLILLDIMMPEMDGYSVCEALKANEQTRDIPVIFLSASNETNHKVKAFALGGVDYITKPFESEEILARVRNHIANQHMQQQFQQQNEQLQKLNSELQLSLTVLAQRSREMELLNRMSSFLQRADTAHEALQLGLPFLEELFAEWAGALYMRLPDSYELTRVTRWGTWETRSEFLASAGCPALAGARSNLVEDPNLDPHCETCGRSERFPTLCVQLITRQEAIGLLLLCREPGAGTEEENDHTLRLAQMVADQIALALANLQLREQLHERAIRDPLTGLFNRYYLDDTLERELSRAERAEEPVGFMLVDIDHFKRYNDTYGHDAGDELLRRFGSFLRSSVRRADIACRFGGEEFLLILPGATLAEMRQRGTFLQVGARELQVNWSGQPLGQITVSIGIASFPLHGGTAAQVISVADAALYRAKANGRDQVIVHGD